MINPKARPCEGLLVRSVAADADCSRQRQRWVLTAAVLGSTMAYVDESVVNVALPAMEKDLGTTLAAMQWVVNAYTLALAALLLTGGAAGDRFGQRRIFAIGIAIFAMTSLGCGFAASAPLLIAARGAQGLGAALMIPSSLALIGASFEESERGRAIGVWSGMTAIAAGLGPLLGGWLVDHWSWRVIFLINPLLAVPTLLIVFRHVPESRDRGAKGSLDWRGTVLAFAGLSCLVYGLIAASTLGWGGAVFGWLSAGALLLAAFVRHEMLSADPMMPPTLFRSLIFSGVNLLTLLLYGALGGTFFFLPFAFIDLHGYSATGAGAAFLPFTIILGLLSRWSGGLVDRFGARWPLILGPLVTALGLSLLALPGADGPYWATFLLPMCIIGLGMAVTVAPLTTTVLNAVAAHQEGIASGINNAVASLASLLAIAVFGSVAIWAFNGSLERQLGQWQGSAIERQAVEAMRGTLTTAAPVGKLDAAATALVHRLAAEALLETFRLVVLMAAAVALAAALTVALTIRGDKAEAKRVRPYPS
jgi:EmrB/QacA subfamily drug resistance transporter